MSERRAAGVALVLLAFASTPVAASPPRGELELGGERIVYDAVRDKDHDGDQKPEQRVYLRDGQLLAAEFDNDGDGRFDAWVRFGEDARVSKELVDDDGDGAPDRVQTMDARGRAQGEAVALSDASAPQVHAIAATPATTEDAATEAQATVAAPVWRIFPLDWRLWSAMGIVGLSLVPAGLALRRR